MTLPAPPPEPGAPPASPALPVPPPAPEQASAPPPSRTARPVRPRQTRRAEATGRELAGLSLLALGVVYGDIGTSPLYAFREAFSPEYGLAPTPDVIYGILSLTVWALVLIVTVKYVGLVLRADNEGEGGILALMALLPRNRTVLVMLALFGCSLLFGEGIITPAISVLGAIEGLEVAAPALSPYVVPLAVVILAGLFVMQKRGTARVGTVFGPIMVVWFTTIAVLGILEIARSPGILTAVNPWYAARLFTTHGTAAFLVLGAVVLVITGAEALYADMGHFGRRPIRLMWLMVVLPSLLLNYFGQGALILRAPEAVRNPFYLLAPTFFQYPLLAIATLAAIVASQALISGAFSLAQQSIQLGFMPRLTVIHTSRAQYGQIYVPEINAALAIGCLVLVVGFGSSSALGAAYGIAVTGTMSITTLLLYAVARSRWKWSALRAASLAAVFLVIEVSFLSANLPKVTHGGWVPLVLGGAVFLVMTTWRRGTRLIVRAVSSRSVPLERFFEEVDAMQPPRVPGTAVFLTAHVEGTPEILLHHLRHNKALHEHVVFLSMVSQTVPEVPEAERTEVEALGRGFHRVIARYGFMELPDIQTVVERCCRETLRSRIDDVSYYFGRPQILPTGPAPMMRWRKTLFAFLARNARSAMQFFGIPRQRVVELGMQIEL